MSLVRQSVSSQVRDALLQRIGSGTLSPGDRIVETTLTKEFGISAIPVREAIRELVAMGVLDSAPHRGAWVRKVTVEETIEAFQVRGALEALAAAPAAKILQKDCRALRKACKAIVAAARRRDFDLFQQENQVFHRTIVEASGNGVLLRVWDSLAFDIRTRFTMEFLRVEDPVAIARQHEPIADALAAGDARRARQLLESHSNSLVKYLRTEALKRESCEGDPAIAVK